MAKAKGYLTLEEAAQQLGMDVDELSQMASRREVRAFADRGTWRFKQQDVDDMRNRKDALQDEDAPIPLVGDDPLDAPVDDAGDQGPPSMGSQKTSVKRRSTDKHGEGDEFEFELSMDSSSFELDAGEDLGLPPAPPSSPAATTGGSEMHMVFDDDDFGTGAGAPKTNLSTSGSMEVKTGLMGAGDSESAFIDGGTGVKTSIAGGASDRRTTQQSFADEGDAGSEVGLGEEVFNLDSEIDLPADQESGSAEPEHQLMETTEEVPVDDLNVMGQEQAAPEFGTSSSPFELSEDDLDEPPAPPTSSFESSSGDDDEVELGDLTPGSDFSSGASGINLHSPADTGVGLEKSGPLSGAGGDEIEFELSLDADATPAPSSADSDSSEFELTLDDEDLSGEHGSSTDELSGEEKDIFETDDNIPALDDEDSGSQAVALEEVDTDLESSDFDFSQDEAASQSEVVALDEEEPVKSASTDDESIEAVDESEEEEEEEPAAVGAGVGGPSLPPASWGALPVIFLLPCVIVLFLLGLMTFEMLHGMWGYKQSYKPTSLIVKPISELFGADFKE